MRALSKPRRRVVLERPQTLLPLEGLSLRLLPAGGGAAARHGSAGRAPAAAGCGGEESARPGQWRRNEGENRWVNRGLPRVISREQMDTQHIVGRAIL